MKLATAQLHGRTFIGLIMEENKILDIGRAEKKLFDMSSAPQTVIECIEMGEKFFNHIKQLETWVKKSDETESYLYSFSEVKWLAPILNPRKNIFCVGKNYREHAVELGSEADIPEHVMLFSKAPTTVIGHEEAVDPHLHLTKELDYEGELAVIIGKKGKRITEKEAMDYVYGYTIINDITARDLQSKHKQFLLGKSLDTSCPMGPYIVHKSAVPDPYELNVVTTVNGEVRQDGHTKDMIFSIEKVIATISQGTTLEPGDIIATGTPAGVGKGFKPAKYLMPGDVVEITINGIGTLSNTIGE